MILYLDSSALVKKYVREIGSVEVNAVIGVADAVGTSILTRAEVSAALAKTVRMGLLTEDEGGRCAEIFRSEWSHLLRLIPSEAIVNRADDLAWSYALRGYDAVHLATAQLWQDSFGQLITFATFDRALWQASASIGLQSFPADISLFLSSSQGRK